MRSWLLLISLLAFWLPRSCPWLFRGSAASPWLRPRPTGMHATTAASVDPSRSLGTKDQADIERMAAQPQTRVGYNSSPLTASKPPSNVNNMRSNAMEKKISSPFFNLALQSLGKKALPFVSDVFEQSSAAVKAFFEHNKQNSSNSYQPHNASFTGNTTRAASEDLDVFTRTSQAVAAIRNDQKKRDWRGQNALLAQLQRDLDGLRREELDAIGEMKTLQQNESLVLAEWQRLQEQEQHVLLEVQTRNASVLQLLDAFQRDFRVFESHRQELVDVTKQGAATKRDIQQLEQRLREAKGLLMELQEREIALIRDLAVRQGEVADCKAALDAEAEQLAQHTAALEALQTQSRVWTPTKDALQTRKTQLVRRLAELGDRCLQRGKDVQDAEQELKLLQRDLDPSGDIAASL